MALHHAEPGEPVDLKPLGSSLGNTNTSAIVKRDRFEAVRLIVPAGTEIPPHHVSGYVMLHCLEGHVELGPKGIQLTEGKWVYLEPDESHSVRGIEDASLLLTILFNQT